MKLAEFPWKKICFHFSLAVIESATQNFDDELVIGRGGFGKVYKGTFDDGSSAAIKRLDSGSKQGASEFWAEIEMLSMLRHCHLVSLIGYCNDENEMILVYELMPHGTLADHLYKFGTRLSWLQRLKVCIGAARGLDYLHTGTGTHHGVIHRDVKSSNILLDDNWEAKISDFGLSKISPTNQHTTSVSTAIKGSFGYLDPEYFSTGRLTRKSDVYAFRVVLLEVFCGRCAVDKSLDEEEWGLVGWAQDCIKEGKILQIVDSTLNGQILLNCSIEFSKIALQCIHNRPKERPTMAEVVVALESALTVQERLCKPDYAAKLAETNTFTRKIQRFFFTSIATNSELSVHLDAKLENKSGSRSAHHSRFTDEDHKPRKNRCIPTELPSLKVFTFEEIKMATRNFEPDTVLGDKGFGRVYKGWVSDETCVPAKKFGMGMPVAIKKLNPKSMQIFKEWKILGSIRDSHVLKMLGYCREDKELILVYEFMKNGGLDNHLFIRSNQEHLSWARRINIIIGAARGLLFLHTCEVQLIYRSFKSSNILLDAHFNAKLSHFGLIKCGPVGDASLIPTSAMVAYGYAAHENMGIGDLSKESNVYGFGVVLMETVTGQRVLGWRPPTEKNKFVEWVSSFLTKKEGVKKIIDPLIEHECPVNSAYKIAILALKCLHHDPKARPSMEKVLEMLEQISVIKMEP